MKAKGIATILLLAFVGVSLAVLVTKETRADRAARSDTAAAPKEVARESASTPSSSNPANLTGSASAVAGAAADTPTTSTRETVIVYYFHGSMRCPTCLKIESVAASEVKEQFASLLNDKSLEWRVVNVDQPENEHFVQDYDLTAQSIILSRVRNGREVQWKNLDRTWELISNEYAFREYISKEVESFVANDKAAGA